jgi:hypothetical protein
MSNLSPAEEPEACVSEPASSPMVEALPGRLSDLGGPGCSCWAARPSTRRS